MAHLYNNLRTSLGVKQKNLFQPNAHIAFLRNKNKSNIPTVHKHSAMQMWKHESEHRLLRLQIGTQINTVRVNRGSCVSGIPHVITLVYRECTYTTTTGHLTITLVINITGSSDIYSVSWGSVWLSITQHY